MTALQKRMIGWSALARAVTTLFWSVWYLVAGSVPVVTFGGLSEIVNLYLLTSRWWDCLYVIPWTTFSVAIVADIKNKENGRLASVMKILGPDSLGGVFILFFIIIMLAYLFFPLRFGFIYALFFCTLATVILSFIMFFVRVLMATIVFIIRVMKKYIPIFLKNWLLAKDS